MYDLTHVNEYAANTISDNIYNKIGFTNFIIINDGYGL